MRDTMNRRALLLACLFVAGNIAHLHSEPAALTEVPFAPITNPPPIQMLALGFTVRESPLNLNNINCF
ncbi:MAG TPA: hypothetical protein VG754_12695, partial [Verrucomicrobiae bacterium]|nr:hypothetical protein [Verrucomicrobiae bacterium]